MLLITLLILIVFQTNKLQELDYDIKVSVQKFISPVNWSDPIESCLQFALDNYKIDISDWYIRYRPNKRSKFYKFEDIPYRTWTYWLSNVERKNKLKEKAYFTDKYLVKQYIANLTEFKYINHAKVIYDFVDNKIPTFEELKALKQKYGAFIVKPNNYCAAQIMLKKDDELTGKKYDHIISRLEKWLHRNYTHEREDHYLYIKPHVFIEQHLNVNGSNIDNRKYDKNTYFDELIEYKIMVINYRAIFMYVVKKPYKNCYSIPDFKYLNARYNYKSNKTVQMKQPSTDIMNKMVKFAETFTVKEQFKFVRVDLYVLKNKIYFSEFTFTPARTIAKITPISFDYYLYDIVCNNSQENVNRIQQFVY